MEDDDDDMVEERRICPGCIGEPFLKQKIAESAAAGYPCSYCSNSDSTISMDELADWIEEALDRHFHRTSDEPSVMDYFAAKEGRWSRPGYPVTDVITDIARLDEDPSCDIRTILDERYPDPIDCSNESPYDKDARYEEVAADDVELQSEWDDFEKILKTENRFFSKRAQAILESIFRRAKDSTAQACTHAPLRSCGLPPFRG
jgi:hypothetical protein